MRREDQFAENPLQTLPRNAEAAKEKEEKQRVTDLPRPPMLGHCERDTGTACRQSWEGFVGRRGFFGESKPGLGRYNRQIFTALREWKSLRSRSSKPFAGNTLRSLKRPLRRGRYGY